MKFPLDFLYYLYNYYIVLQKVTYLFVIDALELEWFKNMKFRQ